MRNTQQHNNIQKNCKVFQELQIGLKLKQNMKEQKDCQMFKKKHKVNQNMEDWNYKLEEVRDFRNYMIGNIRNGKKG